MTDEQTADEILSDARWERELSMERDPTTLRAAIVRALQAARESALDTHANAAVLRMCHEARMMNGIVDYSDPKATGVVRKVLGTLVLTEDGCVWAHGAKVYWRDEPHEQSIEHINGDIAFFEDHGTDASGEVCGTWEKVSQCFASREAAEAAKEGKA